MTRSAYSKKQENIEFQYWQRCRFLPEDKLIALLGHNNFKLSLEAARVLLLKGGSRVIKVAQINCFSNNYRTRALAAFILGEIHLSTKEEKQVIDKLSDLALTDKSATVRSYAVVSFGRRCNEAKKNFSDSLISLAENTILDKSVNVRQSTAFILSMFDNKASIPLLIKLLKDSHSEVKDWAAFAVNVNGYYTPEIRNCFVLLLNENNFDVRYEAIIGLSKMKDKRVTEVLMKELSKDVVYDEMVEVAGYLGNVALLPVLYEIKKKWGLFNELNTAIKILEHLKTKL